MVEFLRRLWGSFISKLGNCKGVDVVEINDTTTANLDNAIPELWATKVRLDAIKSAFWGSRFEGKQGSGMPIIINTDFSKGPGDVIRKCVSSLKNLAKCWNILRDMTTTQVKLSCIG